MIRMDNMKHPVVFCFSGQGSQYYHMGKELYMRDHVFREWMDRLDLLVQPLIGMSVIALLFDEKMKMSDRFDRTLVTHPALFMFEYSLSKMLMARGLTPDYLFGASLGEYTAAAVAGVVEYETMLHIVVHQAKTIEDQCVNGSMMALLAPHEYFRELRLKFPDIQLSSINSSKHFVISGTTGSLKNIEQIARDSSVINQLLPVSHAFHSSMIDPALDRFVGVLGKMHYRTPEIPYMSCTTGGVINQGGQITQHYLWDVCRKPILIQEASKQMESRAPLVYLDLGPSGTMANLIKQNIQPESHSETVAVVSPFYRGAGNMEKISEIVQKYR